MDSKRLNYILLAVLAVLVAIALFRLFPLRGPDSMVSTSAGETVTTALSGTKVVVGASSSATVRVDDPTAPDLTLEYLPGRAGGAEGGSDWWITSASRPASVGIDMGRGMFEEFSSQTLPVQLFDGMKLALGASEVRFARGQTSIRQGLDIQGGLQVLLTAEQTNVTAQQMDNVLNIIQNRVNGLGVSEATVQKESNNSILVQLPGIRDTASAMDLLGQTGKLEFVDLASIPASDAAKVENGKPFPLAKGEYKAALDGSVITAADAVADPQRTGGYAVDMTFNAEGTRVWAALTREIVSRPAGIERRVAIVLDGKVESAPQVMSEIPDGTSQISGSFTADEAKQLATVLQYGSLPVSLKFSDKQEVGPTLGRASLDQGLTAAVVGLLLVALLLAVYYRGLGVLSWFSLGLFAVLYLGVLGLLSAANMFALSLPGIAGMVLSVGLAADTSILIFERFKEEVAMGKSARSAAKSGTLHALMTSVDADVVTFVSAVAIASLAVGPVRGFAVTLMLGIGVDLAVGFLFTRPAVMLLAESVIAKAPGLFGLKGGALRG